MEDYPELLEKILKKGFTHNYELLLFSGSKLSSILEIEEEIARKLRYNIDIDKVKKYLKKEAMPIKEPIPFLNISDKELDKIKALGMSSWQDIAFPQFFMIQASERDWVKGITTKTKELFELPISRLDGIKLSTIPNLKNKGISNIGYYLFGSSKLIREMTKISNSEYMAIKENPSLSTKKSLTDSLDKMIEKAAEKPEPVVDKKADLIAKITAKTTQTPVKTPAPQVKTTNKPTATTTSKKTTKKSSTKAILTPKPVEKAPVQPKEDSFVPPKYTKKVVEAKAISAPNIAPGKITNTKTSSKTSSKKSSKKSSKR